jgi:hypothetical protein
MSATGIRQDGGGKCRGDRAHIRMRKTQLIALRDFLLKHKFSDEQVIGKVHNAIKAIDTRVSTRVSVAIQRRYLNGEPPY